MERKSIKSIKQLPSWFKLEKYEKAKYFNTTEWYEELIPRFFLSINGTPESTKEPWDLNKIWQSIKEDGLLFYSIRKENLNQRVNLFCPQLPIVEKKTESSPENLLTVASLANMYVYMSYWLHEIPTREAIYEMIRILFNHEATKAVNPVPEPISEWMGKPFADFPSDVVMGQENKFAYARVKLDASDEQIKKDFALWLEHERKKRNCPAPKKNFSEVELDSWHDSAVLPYLDLKLWASKENIKITQNTFAQAIFPHAYGIGSDIDPLGKLKTTKKKAEQLMDYKTMKLLESQITV